MSNSNGNHSVKDALSKIAAGLLLLGIGGGLGVIVPTGGTGTQSPAEFSYAVDRAFIMSSLEQHQKAIEKIQDGVTLINITQARCAVKLDNALSILNEIKEKRE